MGKYNVSRDMVTKANSNAGLGITLSDMTSLGGNGANRPATGISWNEAARFVNWLNTSKGFSPAYKFQFQPGDVGYNANAFASLWSSQDTGFSAANPIRNSQAQFFLPSVDEWYKAAYYDPNSETYFDFPTGSNSAPTAVANGTAPFTAVYGQPLSQGPADVTQAGGLSPYGVSIGSNIWDWEETEFDLVNDNNNTARGLRGNRWIDSSFNTMSSSRGFFSAQVQDSSTGFRVATASVPEPSAATLGALVAGLGLLLRSRARVRRLA